MHASDEERIKAVTAKLTGELYVGQRVRGVWSDSSAFPGGVITRIDSHVHVDWYGGDRAAGPVYRYLPNQLKPL